MPTIKTVKIHVFKTWGHKEQDEKSIADASQFMTEQGALGAQLTTDHQVSGYKSTTIIYATHLEPDPVEEVLIEETPQAQESVPDPDVV